VIRSMIPSDNSASDPLNSYVAEKSTKFTYCPCAELEWRAESIALVQPVVM